MVMFLNLQKGQEFVGDYAGLLQLSYRGREQFSFESTVGAFITVLWFWNRAWEISKGEHRGE